MTKMFLTFGFTRSLWTSKCFADRRFICIYVLGLEKHWTLKHLMAFTTLDKISWTGKKACTMHLNRADTHELQFLYKKLTHWKINKYPLIKLDNHFRKKNKYILTAISNTKVSHNNHVEPLHSTSRTSLWNTKVLTKD